MNKVEITDRLATRTGLSKTVAREAVDGVFTAISDALANGEKVRIAGLGTFGTRSRPASTGRNPRTGEAISVSASTSPTFKAGKMLKDAMNAGAGSWTLQRQPTANQGASDRLNVESSRLLCNDGHSASCRAGAEKKQASRRVDGWPAVGLDTASCMRQGSHGSDPS